MDESEIPVVYDDAGQQESLEAFVDQTLRRALRLEELERDADGDVPVRRGTAVVFVRVRGRVDQPSLVGLFSPVLSGVEASGDLYEVLNNVNRQLQIGRAFHVDQRIILIEEILADALRAEDLVWALDYLTQAADLFGPQIQSRFGGQTAFPAADEGGGAGV